MQTRIEGAPAFAHLHIQLAPGESLTAEANAMSSMTADLDLTSKLNGGLIAALLRKYLGGETAFINRFSNNGSEPMALTLVQPTPGDVVARALHGETIYLQPGAFLAMTDGVKLKLKWAGFVSLIAREGLFRVAASGTGTVWYGAYGALLERDIDGEYIVDTAHLVAYEEGISLRLQLAGGIFSSFFGGEGLVTRVRGRGKIVIQTRSLPGLAGWLNPKFWG